MRNLFLVFALSVVVLVHAPPTFASDCGSIDQPEPCAPEWQPIDPNPDGGWVSCKRIDWCYSCDAVTDRCTHETRHGFCACETDFVWDWPYFSRCNPDGACTFSVQSAAITP